MTGSIYFLTRSSGAADGHFLESIMFREMHRPTLILTLAIAATALGVTHGVDREALLSDVAAIETPPEPAQALAANAQACCRAWWNVLGYAVDYLNSIR